MEEEQKIRIESLLNESLQYSKSIDAAMAYINSNNINSNSENKTPLENTNSQKLHLASLSSPTTINNKTGNALHDVVDASHKILNMNDNNICEI